MLVVFQGPHAYVSPSWYASKTEHGKVVPTWNYVMVQARGVARVRDDEHWLRQQITRLTETHESSREMPWHVADAPPAFIEAQLRGIVGVETQQGQGLAELPGYRLASSPDGSRAPRSKPPASPRRKASFRATKPSPRSRPATSSTAWPCWSTSRNRGRRRIRSVFRSEPVRENCARPPAPSGTRSPGPSARCSLPRGGGCRNGPYRN